MEDVPALVALHNIVSADLTSQFGPGPWSSQVSERGILYGMRTSVIYVARSNGRIIATLRLQTRKPWAIDKKYFNPASQHPLYLTGMAVHPFDQRKGVGRRCLDEAQRLARLWPADSIRLDAWDADAGAGDFYRKCGFQEVGRATYRENPHIYFELLLP